MNSLTDSGNEHMPLAPASWAERNGFSHWALGLIWLVIGFILFQVLANLLAVALVLYQNGMEPGADLMALLLERLDLVFIANSIGQILFLGLATWFFVRLHASRSDRPSFLRLSLSPNTGRMVLLSALLFIVIQPVIWYIGYLNTLLPIPETLTELQRSQYEMIENFLRSDGVMWIALFHVAIVPAICEEIMFRGYLQRTFEKSWGVWPAILLSGFLFGAYHLQLGNLLPLATLGILLALVTWLSGSLLPAMVAHFVNNGGAVLLATFYPDVAFADITPETAPPIWMLLIGILGAIGLIRLLYNQSETK
ncbi:MAG: CPBP family intramembrane glutamic endopeptidase [Balneolaceae bacterium]